MSDIGPYGVTQHADAAMVTANQLVGEHAGSVTAHEAGSGFSRALFSTAPYKVPRKGCTGKNGTCDAYPIRGTNRCWFHTEKPAGWSPIAPGVLDDPAATA